MVPYQHGMCFFALSEYVNMYKKVGFQLVMKLNLLFKVCLS